MASVEPEIEMSNASRKTRDFGAPVQQTIIKSSPAALALVAMLRQMPSVKRDDVAKT
jgi:hypothetical protein